MEEIISLEDIKIYSEISNLLIRMNNENYDLVKALKNNTINYEELINKMRLIKEANDGGSKIYESTSEIEVNNHFYLIKCNNINGNKNVLISDDVETIEYCKIKK